MLVQALRNDHVRLASNTTFFGGIFDSSGSGSDVCRNTLLKENHLFRSNADTQNAVTQDRAIEVECRRLQVIGLDISAQTRREVQGGNAIFRACCSLQRHCFSWQWVSVLS